MDTSISYDTSNCWVSPEDLIEDLQSICKFGDNDIPLTVTSCFKVWGRGRSRTPISQIVLPASSFCVGHSSEMQQPTTPGNTSSNNFPRSKGRGHLLLLDGVDDFDASHSNDNQFTMRGIRSVQDLHHQPVNNPPKYQNKKSKKNSKQSKKTKDQFHKKTHLAMSELSDFELSDFEKNFPTLQ